MKKVDARQLPLEACVYFWEGGYQNLYRKKLPSKQKQLVLSLKFRLFAYSSSEIQNSGTSTTK